MPAPTLDSAPTRDGAPAAAPPPTEPPAPPRAPAGARLERLGLAVGVAAILAYALAGLDRHSLWTDEAYTLAAANYPGHSLTRTHGTMGLYYVVMWAWSQVSTAVWWLRLPSVLFALATLAVVRSVARRVGGSALAALAVPALALVPIFAWKAIEARSYALATLLAACSWWLALRLLDRDDPASDRTSIVGLAGLALLGVFSHGLFFVHLLPLVAVAALHPRRRRAVSGVLPAVGVAAAIALVLRESGASNVGTMLPGGPLLWGERTLQMFLPGPAVLGAVLVLLALAGGGGAVAAVRRRGAEPLLLVPLAWAVVPALGLGAISLVTPLYNPRYLAPAAPGLALLLGQGVLVGARAVAVRSSRPVRTGTTLALGAVALATLLGSLVARPYPNTSDWRTAAQVVATGARPDDGLVFANLDPDTPAQYRPPFEAAWNEIDGAVAPVVLSSDRPLGRVRRYEDIRSPQDMGALAAAHRRVWIVDTGQEAALITQDPAFAAFALSGHWVTSSNIHVRLYEQDGGR